MPFYLNMLHQLHMYIYVLLSLYMHLMILLFNTEFFNTEQFVHPFSQMLRLVLLDNILASSRLRLELN